MSPKIRTFLEQLASRRCWFEDEDTSIYDFCGGNYDDAYSGGWDDGAASLARSILKMLDEETN